MHEEFSGPYVINHGDVWFKEPRASRLGTELRHVCDGSEEIAIAHDGEMLLKAGSATAVENWLDKNREKLAKMSETLMDMGCDPMEIILVRLPVSPETVSELNACVAISGRVSRLEDNLARIGIENPALFSRPNYPR
jgi:hypothetical protein